MAISSSRVQQGHSHTTMSDLTRAVNQGIANTNSLITNFSQMMNQRRMQEDQQAFATLQNQRARKNELFLTQAKDYPGGIKNYVKDHYDQFVDWGRSVYGWDDDTIKSIGTDISNQLLTPSQWMDTMRALSVRTGIGESAERAFAPSNTSKTLPEPAQDTSMQTGMTTEEPSPSPSPGPTPGVQVRQIDKINQGTGNVVVDGREAMGDPRIPQQRQNDPSAIRIGKTLIDTITGFIPRVKEVIAAAGEERKPSTEDKVEPQMYNSQVGVGNRITYPSAAAEAAAKGGAPTAIEAQEQLSAEQLAAQNEFIANSFDAMGLSDIEAPLDRDVRNWEQNDWNRWIAYKWGEKYLGDDIQYSRSTGDNTGYRGWDATEESAETTKQLMQFIDETGGIPASRDDFALWRQEKGLAPEQPSRAMDASGAAMTADGKTVASATETSPPGDVPDAEAVPPQTLETATSAGESEVAQEYNAMTQAAETGNASRMNYHQNRVGRAFTRATKDRPPLRTYDDVSPQQAQAALDQVLWMKQNEPERFKMFYPEEARRQLELGKAEVSNKILEAELKRMNKRFDLGFDDAEFAKLNAEARLAQVQATLQERYLAAMKDADPNAQAVAKLVGTMLTMQEKGTWDEFAERAEKKNSLEAAQMEAMVNAFNYVFSPGTGDRIRKEDIPLFLGMFPRTVYSIESATPEVGVSDAVKALIQSYATQ